MNALYEQKLTCCFTGHRPPKLPWGEEEDHPGCMALKTRIAEELESLYQKGCRHFIMGMAQGCDMYFAEEVLKLRSKYGDVTLEAAIPCRSQPDGWKKEEKERYRLILEQCDVETLVQRNYSRGCMLRRNRYMVEHSGTVLAVYDGSGAGGTMYTLNYALDQGLETVIIPLEQK